MLPRLISMHATATGTHTPATGAGNDSVQGSGADWYDFESLVCYAFITRFPLFSFFFQVIFDIITTERLTRLVHAEAVGRRHDSIRAVYQVRIMLQGE